MNKRRVAISLSLLFFLLGIMAFYWYGRSFWVPVVQTVMGKRTVSDILGSYGGQARERMRPYFHQAGVLYPPNKITLLAIKDDEVLELWAESGAAKKLVHIYPIQALSGISGPKLREGDMQVPEGIYTIEGLNPNSSYHLSLKLNYPNEFDLKYAKAEGRVRPGTNIFIHGNSISIGCLAMGDEAIEEIFVLAADVGKSNIAVAISPRDPRLKPLSTEVKPSWVGQLYDELNKYFLKHKKPNIS